MWSLYRRNPSAFWHSIALHLVLVALLLLGPKWLAPPRTTDAGRQVVQARLVDEAELARWQASTTEDTEVPPDEVTERRAATEEEGARLRAEARAAAEAQRQAEEAARRRADAAEAQRRAEEAAERQAEAERQAAAEEAVRRQAEARAAAEAQRRAEEAAERRAEAERQAAAEEAARRQAEARAAAEAQRRAEEESRRVAEQARDEEAFQQALAEELASMPGRAEENVSGSRRAQDSSPYVSAIQAHVHRVWVRPPDTGDESLACLVSVRLIEGGEVVAGSVRVKESSGNAAFDRSAVAAIYKASPLPVPTGPDFASFRNFNFLFTPR
jgi:colicin import membrane protein